MLAGHRTATRGADQWTDCGDQRPSTTAPGAMVLQSSCGHEAAPQMFVRLTGSHQAKKRASRAVVTE
ncbi:hypothetical protein AC629_00020 [Bradyrhizobium sp. NAS80.1]|nr:hypothetical protein AC629_00020 [Bradyrhizobium sp. NAS80.1]